MYSTTHKRSTTNHAKRVNPLVALDALKAQLDDYTTSAGDQTPALLSFPEWLPQTTPQWTWDWKHQLYLYEKLAKVTSGEIDRLMVFMPPRHAKSETITVRYPVWRMYQQPTTRTIVGAYNQRLANIFSRKARKVAAASEIDFDKERRAVEEWQTSAGGGLRAVGVGAGVTGTGAQLIIVDDPVKSREEANSETYREKVWDWYTDDLYTRLEPGGAIILIMTRWHEDDLAGRLLAEQENGGDKWEIVNLPALAEENDPLGRNVGEALCPERYDETALLRIKGVLGSGFYALYQQRPQPAGGSIFHSDWFTFASQPPEKPAQIVQAWDTAMKTGKQNDYSVCVTAAMYGTTAYVLNVYRAKLETPELLKAVRNQFEQWQPNIVLMEDKASGTGAIQTIKKTEYQAALLAWQEQVAAQPAPQPTGNIRVWQQQRQTLPKPAIIPIVPVQATGDKVERANLAAPYLESGRVVFCRGAWNSELLDEALSFPHGRHDDQIDALVYAILRLFSRDTQQQQATMRRLYG